jgi:hypothetical protein
LPLIFVSKDPAAAPVILGTIGRDQEYKVPDGTTPFVIGVGTTTNEFPEHIVADIAVIAAAG